jgi:hypothetical protein
VLNHTSTHTHTQNLRDKTLAGKRAIFDVEILSASKRVVPDLTDEFAQRVRAGLTAEQLLAQLRAALDDEAKKDYVPARNRVLGVALADVMEVAVPETLVTNQAREKFAVMMAEMRDNGVADDEIKKQINPDNFNKYKEIVRADIVRDFKVSMATDEIARLEAITVPDYQVEEQMQAIKKDAAAQSADFDEDMIRAKVQTTMARQAVFDWLAERANLTVVYNNKDDDEFDERLMQQLAEESLEREKDMEDKIAQNKEIGETLVVESATPVAVVAIEPERSGAETPVAVVEREAPAAQVAVVEPEAPVAASAPETSAAETPVAAVVEPEAAVVVSPVVELETPGIEPEAVEVLEAPAESVVVQPETPEEKSARYASMSLQERAFQILVDTGAVDLHYDPSSSDYDSSKDSEIAEGDVV